MAILTRGQILAADDRKTVPVSVPEWGGDVLVRSLTGAERDKFEEGLQTVRGNKTKRNLKNFRARLVALCVVNEQGELLFSPPDIDALGGKSVAALQRVFNKCNELNGMSDEDIEELTQDFDEAADEASTSD